MKTGIKTRFLTAGHSIFSAIPHLCSVFHIVESEKGKILDKRAEFRDGFERLLLNHANTPGFLAPGGEEFNLGPETRLDRSELLCNKVLLKHKGDRESF